MKSGQLDTRPHCPTCKKMLDGFTAVDHEQNPQPGDVTICAYCNEVLQFTDDMGMKLASPEAIEECGLLEVSRSQRQARELKRDLTLAKKIKHEQRKKVMTDPQNATPTGSRTPEEVLDDVIAVQCADGNWNYDPYMHGLANGLLLAKSIFTKVEPDFLEAPETWKKDVELKADVST